MELTKYILTFLFFFVSFSICASTWYVNVESVNDNATGTSWQDAFNDLQMGLSVAQPGDEIWVAHGVYYPTDTEDRTINFGMRSDVSVYGGFLGTEEERSQRDFLKNVTILNGNIGDPDIIEDNSFNVVRAIDIEVSAVLDGFLVTGGNATDPEPFERGGGMFSKNASITVRNCTFSENTASYGGGVYNLGSTTALYYNCRIINNTAVHVGGGVYNFLRCNVALDRCIIADNKAILDFAGALYNFQSSMDIYNSLVCFNKAPSAGTFYMTNSSEVQFYNTNVVFNESEAYPVFNLELASDANFYNSFFWENNSESEEGPMYFKNPESTISYNFSLIDGIQINTDTTEQLEVWISSEESYQAYRHLVDGDPIDDDAVLAHPLFINEGDLTYNPLQNDLLGNLRVMDGQIDIGMLESSDLVSTATETDINENFKIYPNPIREGNDMITIDSGSNKIQKVELSNMLGKNLASYKFSLTQIKKLTLELPQLKEGIYFLHIGLEDMVYHTKKLMVVK